MITQKELHKSLLFDMFKIAMPVAMQSLLSVTASMVDTMMIAPLGELSVGAVGMCSQFANIFFHCYWGFVGGGIMFLSQYKGAEDEDGICRTYGLMTGLMMAVALIFGGFAVFAPYGVMRVYTDKTAICEIGAKYIAIMGYAFPLQVMTIAVSAVLRSCKKVRITLFAAIVSVVSNVVFNYILINGKFGFPEMGVRGAATATVISGGVNLIILLLCAKFTGFNYIYKFKKIFSIKYGFFKLYLKKSLPIIANEIFAGVGFLVCNTVMGRQSEPTIAAFAVFSVTSGFVMAFFTGLTNASAVFVGNAVGAGKVKDAMSIAKRVLLYCFFTILTVMSIICIFHPFIFRAMGLSDESFTLCRGMIFIYAVAIMFRTENWLTVDIFRVGGETTVGAIADTVFMYVIVLPLMCILGIYLRVHPLIVFAAQYADEPIKFTFLRIYFGTGKWIKPITKQGKEAIKGLSLN